MPKLVLMDRGEKVLTQWMFDADKNEMGHLTLREPAHLAAFIEQLQEALDKDKDSYVLTEQKPYPCDFCGKACSGKHCSNLCEEMMAKDEEGRVAWLKPEGGWPAKEVDERSCYSCNKKVTHVNDGGVAWVAYKDKEDTVFYCNNEQCSVDVRHCCDLDVVAGSKCPNCGEKAE